MNARLGLSTLTALLLAGMAAIAAEQRSALQPLDVRYPDVESLTPADLGKRLVHDLHCVACHEVPAEVAAPMRGEDGWPVAPVLTFEGDRVQEGWLPGFLAEPYVMRPASFARMPTFTFTDEERGDLVAYVRSLRDPNPLDLGAYDFDVHGEATAAELDQGKFQLRLLRCNQCHLIEGKLWNPDDVPKSPDLAYAAGRLQRPWVYRWLIDPQAMAPGTKMPNFFYSEGEELTDDPESQIDALVKYVFSLGQPREGAAPAGERTGSAERGAALFQANNCSGCHIVGEVALPERAGPPLAFEGARAQAGWLRQYFRTPHPIRPIGYRKDKLKRMPNFRLNEEEVQAVAAYLMTLRDVPYTPTGKDWTPDPALFREADGVWLRHQCGTCHGPRPTGEYPGPPTATMPRLQPEFVYQFCVNPEAFGLPPGLEHPAVSAEEAALLAPVLARPLPPGRTQEDAS